MITIILRDYLTFQIAPSFNINKVTIYNNLGKIINSGAIKSRFPSNQNDMDKIIKVQFPLIAQRIVANLLGLDAVGVR